MALMTNDGKPTEPQKKAVDESLLKEMMKMLPKEKVEATEPKNVVLKMMVEGRADKLLEMLKTILPTFVDRDAYTGNIKSTTKPLIMTLMLEEKQEKKK